MSTYFEINLTSVEHFKKPQNTILCHHWKSVRLSPYTASFRPMESLLSESRGGLKPMTQRTSPFSTPLTNRGKHRRRKTSVEGRFRIWSFIDKKFLRQLLSSKRSTELQVSRPIESASSETRSKLTIRGLRSALNQSHRRSASKNVIWKSKRYSRCSLTTLIRTPSIKSAKKSLNCTQKWTLWPFAQSRTKKKGPKRFNPDQPILYKVIFTYISDKQSQKDN